MHRSFFQTDLKVNSFLTRLWQDDYSIQKNEERFLEIFAQISNLQEHALEGENPHQALFDKPPNVNNLRVLGSTVYVFIHEEERNLKSEKIEARALKGTLVGYDGHTIYRVFIREQDKVIRMKYL